MQSVFNEAEVLCEAFKPELYDAETSDSMYQKKTSETSEHKTETSERQVIHAQTHMDVLDQQVEHNLHCLVSKCSLVSPRHVIDILHQIRQDGVDVKSLSFVTAVLTRESLNHVEHGRKCHLEIQAESKRSLDEEEILLAEIATQARGDRVKWDGLRRNNLELSADKLPAGKTQSVGSSKVGFAASTEQTGDTEKTCKSKEISDRISTPSVRKIISEGGLKRKLSKPVNTQIFSSVYDIMNQSPDVVNEKLRNNKSVRSSKTLKDNSKSASVVSQKSSEAASVDSLKSSKTAKIGTQKRSKTSSVDVKSSPLVLVDLDNGSVTPITKKRVTKGKSDRSLSTKEKIDSAKKVLQNYQDLMTKLEKSGAKDKEEVTEVTKLKTRRNPATSKSARKTVVKDLTFSFPNHSEMALDGAKLNHDEFVFGTPEHEKCIKKKVSEKLASKENRATKSVSKKRTTKRSVKECGELSPEVKRHHIDVGDDSMCGVDLNSSVCLLEASHLTDSDTSVDADVTHNVTDNDVSASDIQTFSPSTSHPTQSDRPILDPNTLLIPMYGDGDSPEIPRGKPSKKKTVSPTETDTQKSDSNGTGLETTNVKHCEPTRSLRTRGKTRSSKNLPEQENICDLSSQTKQVKLPVKKSNVLETVDIQTAALKGKTKDRCNNKSKLSLRKNNPDKLTPKPKSVKKPLCEDFNFSSDENSETKTAETLDVIDLNSRLSPDDRVKEVNRLDGTGSSLVLQQIDKREGVMMKNTTHSVSPTNKLKQTDKDCDSVNRKIKQTDKDCHSSDEKKQTDKDSDSTDENLLQRDKDSVSTEAKIKRTDKDWDSSTTKIKQTDGDFSTTKIKQRDTDISYVTVIEEEVAEALCHVDSCDVGEVTEGKSSLALRFNLTDNFDSGE